jgi:hypothetical protein
VWSCGIRRKSDTIAATPITLTPRNVARHPRCWPVKVATGTPAMLATVSPRNISETERALRSGATRPVATTAPTPKKAPCGSPLRKRAASSQW